MSVKYYRKNSCRLCNSKKLEDVIELSPTPPGNNFLSKNQLNEPVCLSYHRTTLKAYRGVIWKLWRWVDQLSLQIGSDVAKLCKII